MPSRVRVPAMSLAFGGWKGTITIDGDVMRVVGDDPTMSLEIDAAAVKRYSFNGNNGLWIFRMKDGRKVRLQSAGGILSADRSPAGRETNDEIRALMRKHRLRGLSL
jgi:hypothetical protein